MSRLRQPGDSHYDVLGLSPGASDEEIEDAFRQLIDRQGYKVGVALDRQWLRAREIKAAHATLGDPAKRRAYDESLGGVPEPAPWAMTAKDPATDDLVLPDEEPDATVPVDNGSPPDAVIPADETPADAKPEPTPDAVPEPAAEEVSKQIDDRQSPPDLAPTLNDNEPSSAAALDDRKPVSARTWGVAAVVAAGLGLVFLSSWPGGDRQPSTGEGTAKVAASAEQASGAGLGFVDQAPGIDRAAVSTSEPQGAAAGDSPAASDARTSDQATAQDGGDFATTGTADGQSQTDMTSTVTPPEATSQPVEVEARVAAPAPTPPVARVPQTAPAPNLGAESSTNLARSEPQWIGGGPTDADNRRGRYQGTVAVQVTVEADGRVSRCAPVRGSGNAGLDALTCSLVQQRARFSPALDAQGRPVVSQTYTTFFWGRKPRN